MPSSKTRPITRADIEAKLEEIRRSADAGADAAKGAGTAIGIGALVLALVIVGVMLLLMGVLLRILRAARVASDPLGSLICYGVGSFIFLQTVVSIGMNLRVSWKS